jgi:Ca2+-binding RTX toxin-like protein
MGGGGADTLVAGIGTDTLVGGAQPVTFIPGQGSDTLTSSTIGNTLSYGNVPFPTPWKRPPLTLLGGAKVNLSSQLAFTPNGTLLANTASGGWGATVGLAGAGITTVEGSPAADTFVTGSGQAIDGNGGNDLFVVNGGNNTLTAAPNSASRFLFEGTGTNNTIFGNGNPAGPGNGNSTVDFSQATSGVTVNLQAGFASRGAGDSQVLSGVLNIVGSPYSDVLVAGAPNATIDGDGARAVPGAPANPPPGDFLQTGPTGGDTLTDSSGTNTFCAATDCQLSGTKAGGGQRDTLTGGSGPDTFFALNSTADTIDGGGGFNEAEVDASDSLTNIQQTF